MSAAPWDRPRVEAAPWDKPPEETPSVPPQMTPQDATKAFKAGVYSKMIGVEPSYAYQNADEIQRQLSAIDPGHENDSFAGAVETGLEDTPLGMLIRGKAPDPFESNNALLRFVHNTVSFATDPFVVVPTVAGAIADIAVPGAAIVGFVGGSALDAGLRQALMDHYEQGNVKSFKELTDRAGDVLWSATKGALSAEAFSAAGEIPVPGAIADNTLASTAVKGLYQASAITTAGALLDKRVPKLQDFEDSALMVVPLNLATGGVLLGKGDARQAAMDVYSKDGTTPQETGLKLEAQPPVVPDLAPGLKSAITFGDSFIEADAGETHPELAERVTGKAPIDLDKLNSDPSLADDVLDNPAPHLQEVIDRAWQLKKEALDSGDNPDGKTIDELYNRGSMKSGRGFVTPDGKFLDRNAAKRWVKDNEPQTHEMWAKIAGDDKQAFHADDYGQARMRVQNRNVAEGEPDLAGASPQLNDFLSKARGELNTIKAGDESKGYGNSAIRTLFVGPRNLLRAEGEQVVSRMRKLIPEFRDQEALSFLRDYRDDPQQLRAEIEEIRNGDNEKLKAYIPSMERALNPSPEMLKADQQLTQYFGKALDLGRQLGILESSIDPARYSPRLFMKVMEDAENQEGVGRPKFTPKTPHAIQRQYLRVLDPLKEGNFEARTFNALDETSVYADRFSTAAATKLFTTELKNSELGKWGNGKTVPEGWTELAPGQRGFHQTISVKDPETGEMNTFSRGLYVPKQISDAMKPMLQSGGVPEAMAKVLHAQQYIKTMELGLSVFHMKALSITAMNNMSFSEFARALNSDNSSPEFEAAEREGAVWGLETTKTGTPYEAYRGLKPSSLPTGLDKLANTPVIKEVDAFAKALTRDTFDVVQRKFKVMDFSQKQSAWIANHPEATETEYGKAMRGITKEVNAAYGGLNWDVLGVSKGMRDMSRLFILAPDWTFSNVLNAKYALSPGEGIAGSSARSFWVKSFATGISLTAAMSIMVGGKYDVTHPTQVYMGKDKDGKDMYADWFFAGAPKDLATLTNHVIKDGALTGLVNFLSYKFGPIAGTAAGLMKNKSFTGGAITKPNEGFAEKTAREAGYVATQAAPAPFSVKNVAEMLMSPDKHVTWTDASSNIGSLSLNLTDASSAAVMATPILDSIWNQGWGKPQGLHPGIRSLVSKLLRPVARI